MTSLIAWIIVGAIGGWLAGYVIAKDTALRLNDVILGMIGAVVGGWIASAMGIGGDGIIFSVLIAFVGAVIVAWIYHKLTGRSAV